MKFNLTEADLARFHGFKVTDACLIEHQVRRITDREARNGCGIRWGGGDLEGRLGVTVKPHLTRYKRAFFVFLAVIGVILALSFTTSFLETA